MKRGLLTLLGCLTFSLSAVAMEDTSRMASIGVTAGANFGNASTPSSISSDTRTGYAVGVSMDIGLGGPFSLQPELLYVQDGSSLVDGAGVRIRTSFQNLELPVLLKARIGDWKAAPYAFAGPVGTFRMGRSVEYEVAGTTTTINFHPRQWDFGVAMGVGLDLGPFFANARYNMGLVDIDENSADFKSRGFMVLAGLRI